VDTLLEILGNIGFDWRVALANLINFSIVFYLLNRFIFSKIRQTISVRTQKIEKGIADAESAELSLKNARHEEKNIIDKAHLDAHDIMTQASHRGNELISKAEEQAVVHSEDIKNRASKDIENQQKEYMRKLNTQAVDLVVSGVEKILRTEVDAGRNEDYTKKILTS
jgi:F-type H+-transporting ATPase subunit b